MIPLRHLRVWLLAAVAAFPAVAQATPVDVVELVNFECPHCRHMDAYVPRLAKQVASEGGVFRVAPVEPALKGAPDISVRFWYALDDISGDIVADQAAHVLYRGYQKGATLNSAAGVYAWLSDYMTGLPKLSLLRTATYSPRVLAQWRQALLYTRYLPDMKVPAFIFIDADNFAEMGTIQRGPRYKNAGAVYRGVQKFLARNRKPPPPIRLPWKE